MGAIDQWCSLVNCFINMSGMQAGGKGCPCDVSGLLMTIKIAYNAELLNPRT